MDSPKSFIYSADVGPRQTWISTSSTREKHTCLFGRIQKCGGSLDPFTDPSGTSIGGCSAAFAEGEGPRATNARACLRCRRIVARARPVRVDSSEMLRPPTSCSRIRSRSSGSSASHAPGKSSCSNRSRRDRSATARLRARARRDDASACDSWPPSATRSP